MYISADIASRIKFLASSRKISVKQVLSDTGLGLNTMSNMRNSMPKADNLAKIADYLHCSVDYLLGRTDDPSAASGDPLPDPAARLIRSFDALNPEGQERLQDYADDLVASGRYIKAGSTGVVEAK